MSRFRETCGSSNTFTATYTRHSTAHANFQTSGHPHTTTGLIDQLCSSPRICRSWHTRTQDTCGINPPSLDEGLYIQFQRCFCAGHSVRSITHSIWDLDSVMSINTLLWEERFLGRQTPLLLVAYRSLYYTRLEFRQHSTASAWNSFPSSDLACRYGCHMS